MPDDSGAPQRRSARKTMTRFVWYVSLETKADETHGQLAHTTDIAMEGLGFFANHALPIGERLFCEITTPKHNISAVCRVVHCAVAPNGLYRVGVRFEVVPPNDRTVLERMTRE